MEEKFTDYDPYDYDAVYDYPDSLEVNSKDVDVTIENIWIPKDIDAPDPDEARLIVEGTEDEPPTLMITGSVTGTSEYQIKITYYYLETTGDSTGTNLMVETIGIWLPPGFDYDDEGSCSLADDDDTADYAVPDVDDYKSGKAVVWDFGGSVSLKDFLAPDYAGYPMEATITFNFKSDQPNRIPGIAVSWIDTTGVEVDGIDYTWDADIKVYKITSTATDAVTGKQTIVDAYTAKSEMRKLGSAMAGDYCAVGNTLMTSNDNGGSRYKYRETFFKESSATIQSIDPEDIPEEGVPAGHIPSNATVEAAYLYWSGWIDFHYLYQEWGWWIEGEIAALKYPDDPTPENLRTLVEDEAKVNRVMFGITGNMTQIPEDGHRVLWQVEENDDRDFTLGTWSYSCFYNVTEQIKGLIEAEEINLNGIPKSDGKYILSHAVVEPRPGYPEYSFEFDDTTGETGYPLGTPAISFSESRYEYAYAGWSLIIIYSSPETKGHQLYLYDDFTFIGIDYELEIPVSGFLAPDDTAGSHLTYFVGEGDEHYGSPPQGASNKDYFKVNGNYLSDGTNPRYNVFNSYSNALDDPNINGIDIDTFDMSYCINPEATSAEVIVGSGYEIYNVVYIILSFRSETTIGGTLTYLVRG